MLAWSLRFSRFFDVLVLDKSDCTSWPDLIERGYACVVVICVD